MEVVSREQELAALHAFVEGERDRATVLVLEGEAGIGKSTLWLAAVEHAERQGLRALTARPAEAEQGLAHVGLGDLLEPVLDEVLSALPPPRRRALETVLLLAEEAPADAVDPRALGIATRSALQSLAEAGPVVVAIDDFQWFDASSANALAFALRRLAGTPLRLLLARRPADGTAPPELAQALGPDAVRLIDVGPLSIGALHRLLRDRLGRPFARQTLMRIHERAGGNPFFALELAGILDRDVDPSQPLPVPDTLEEIVRARLSGLPPSSRDALALAAALGTASERLLMRAGVPVDALEAAVAAHVIAREHGSVRFTHPLLASVLCHDLGPARRQVHGRIAELVGDDPLLHARHLALAREAPDADVAATLDDAARHATDRGAAAAAAELAQQALRFTPAPARDEARRRALIAARAHQAAGEWTRARTIAAELLSEAEAGPRRAEALVLLAELESVDHGVALLEEALQEAAGRPALQSVIHSRLAWATRFRKGYVRALEHARAALELANALDDRLLAERAHAVQAVLGWMVGDADAPALPVRVEEFAAAVGGEQLVQEATLAVVNTFAPMPAREEARALLEREHLEWRERAEPRAARALWGLAWIEFWAGRWALAAKHAEEAHDISTQYGLEVPQDHLPIAVVAVHRGLLGVARSHSERALALAEEQFTLHPPQHLAILGLVALAEGRRAEAADRLATADARAAELGWGEPSIRWWVADHVELLLGLGRIDDAERLLDRWEADASRLGREWVLAQAARCRGLVAAARGEVDAAVSLLEAAAARHDAVDDPFGRARTLLAEGVVRRRARQKRPARERLEAARAAFDAVGAAVWEAQARSELGRLGGRTRETGLTPAERRVASLVAEGRTNREIAAALFLGERTVASHLTHIYTKLGVHSRTELAHRLHVGDPAESTEPGH